VITTSSAHEPGAHPGRAPRTGPLDIAPVIPVVTIGDVDTAVPLARALARGGLPIIEVTLRSPAALAAIARIATEVPETLVGAGTLLRPGDVDRAVAAGAGFLISPGGTPGLVDAMLSSGLSCLPGVATASEAIGLIERGITDAKFFPAEPAGGPAYLRALAGPLPTIRFCPTGGIDATTAPHYLSLPNVACVGGSWMVPPDACAAGDWLRIEHLARKAAALGQSPGQ
jgi:2-dehydro-3-deoxyphosphogluconate aldolase/(4S)-4-hydroxy-2-oxoglutarate aldolase